MRKVYRGRDIEVSFDLDICIHVAECLRGHAGAFQLGRRPWVEPDKAEADVVAEVVERCPSGALQYLRLDGGPQERHTGTTVTPVRNGPLVVVGEIEVRKADGSVEKLPRATLCRCGQSKNKPFCDNQHLRVGFFAPGQLMHIHISPVRPHSVTEPISKAEDPRAAS